VKQKKRLGRYIIIITILGFSPIYYTPTIVYTHNTRREPQGLSFFFLHHKSKERKKGVYTTVPFCCPRDWPWNTLHGLTDPGGGGEMTPPTPALFLFPSNIFFFFFNSEKRKRIYKKMKFPFKIIE
jgi:hypothetical protein